MSDGIGAVVLFLIAVSIYFLPAIVGKDKRNAGAILVLNLLLGWTLIGWVVALVWAMTTEPQAASESPAALLPSVVPTYRCPRCQQPVLRDAQGCANCGVAYVRASTPPSVNSTKKKCPDCAEMVKADARKCRFCGHMFGA